jgi:DNA-binding NarL/FixJ family response regulator
MNTPTFTPFDHAMRQLSLASVGVTAEPRRARPAKQAATLSAQVPPAREALPVGLGRGTGWGAASDDATPLLPGSHLDEDHPKVLLVDDHDLVRMGIKALLGDGDSAGIEWIEASTLTDALQLYHDHPDVSLVLLDLNLADCKGLHGLKQLLSMHPEARVLILSGTHDEFVVRQAKAMGAAGYLNKAASPVATRQTLLAMLHPAEHSDAPQSFRSSQPFPKSPSGSSYDRVAELGPRHLEILELVLSGCTNQEISNSTHLSLGTVKNYVSTILLALDVKSRSHLISLFR